MSSRSVSPSRRAPSAKSIVSAIWFAISVLSASVDCVSMRPTIMMLPFAELWRSWSISLSLRVSLPTVTTVFASGVSLCSSAKPEAAKAVTQKAAITAAAIFFFPNIKNPPRCAISLLTRIC